ncbi:MAG TPA: oligosaccharide flippase family protein [Acidobacteriota bacterium]
MSPLIKNTFYSTMTNALQSLANVLVVVLLARPLGTAEFGRLMLAVSFASAFAIIVEYGFRWYATKEVSQKPEAARTVAGDIFNAQLLLALGATLLAFTAARLLAYPTRTMVIVGIVWLSTVLMAFTQVTRSVFRGLDMFPSDTALNLVLFTAIALALVPPLLFLPTTVAFAVAILGARVVYFAAGQALFKKRVGRMDFHFSIRKGGRLLAGTIAYGTQIMFARLLLEWNTIVLHQYRGNIGVGLYQAAFRFLLGTMMIGDILLQAFFPVIAQLAIADRRRFIKTSTVMNRYLLSGGAYMSGAFFVFAPELIHLIFGAPYAAAVPIMRILAFAVMANFISAAPAIAMTALGKQGARARASALVMVFNVLCAFVLIPALGAQGAAVSMVASFMLLSLFYLYFTFKTIHSLFFDRRSLYASLLALAGSVAAWQLKSISLFLGVAAYAALGALLFLTATTGEEKKEMLRALRFSAAPAPEIEP